MILYHQYYQKLIIIHIKNKDHIFTNSPSPSFSSSSDSTSSSSSNNTSISTNDHPYNETDEDSVETKIKKFTKKSNKKKLKSKHLKKRKNTKLTSDKVYSQALQMIKFLETLHMRKLDLKHEPRLRRIAFLE